MRTLRLFINTNIQTPINWVLINDDDTEESGASSFAELALYENVTLEVYLSALCCSIFKTSVLGISTKRLTEELVLGLIEENLVDDIDEVKPVIVRVEDDIVYVAVFNREFFTTLYAGIQHLGFPVRFIQSFVYTTLFQEKSWTVFLSRQQRFLRTSQYEYYSLDDNLPLPALLEDMLAINKPESLLIYADEESGYNIKHIANQLDIPCTDVTNQYEYGVPVWNFYKQKSTSFKIRLEGSARHSLEQLLKSFKYMAFILVAFWLLDIITTKIDSLRVKSQITNNLKGVVTVVEPNKNLMETAADKITTLRHQRALYSPRYDAVALLKKFLEVVSVITPNDIKQISYERKEMQIILGNNFDTSQFSSYQDILETKRVIATIEDYKIYAKQHKADRDSNNKNELGDQSQVIDDAAWIVTLKPATMFDSRRSN